VVFGFVPRRTLHTAQIASSSRILYPYHPLFGQDVEVFGAAGGLRDIVYIRLPNKTTRGIPGWMFDEVVCASVRSADRATIDCHALLRLSQLLDFQSERRRAAENESATLHSESACFTSQPPSSLATKRQSPKPRDTNGNPGKVSGVVHRAAPLRRSQKQHSKTKRR
jgi:hypothetical protein